MIVANEPNVDSCGNLAHDEVRRERRICCQSGKHIPGLLAIVQVIGVGMVAETVPLGVAEEDGHELIRIFSAGTGFNSAEFTKLKIAVFRPDAQCQREHRYGGEAIPENEA